VLLYNSGMADSALRVIEPCLENKDYLNNISKETRARIFRLAALSSIMNYNPSEAEKYAREMLINQPDYEYNQNDGDLMEFGMMLDKMSPQPSFRVGFSGGFNIPFLKLEKRYSNYYIRSDEYNLNGSIGYQFGIIGEKMLKKSISVEAGAGISRIILDYSHTGIDNATYLSVKYLYNQDITWVEIPVIAKYYFDFNSFRPYLEGGITGRFLLNEMEISDDYGRYWFTNSSNSDKILATFLTDFEYIGILLGGGANYNFNKFSLRLDLRYNYYLKNLTVSSKFDNVGGYEDIGPDEKFYYTDDINLLNVNCLQVSIGFLYNLSYKVF
jgi:hypothetical protein